MDTYGLIGWPVKHSLSPAMHNAAFKELGIDAEYKLFEVKPEGLEDFLLNRKDVLGFNITIPHKVRAKEILERNFPLDKNKGDFKDSYYVEVSGAVNTVKRDGDKLKYCNTDVEGFRKSLESDLKFDIYDSEDKNVFLIGCGGAGRAVIAALSYDFLKTKIKKIYVYDKSKEAFDSIKNHFSKLYKGWADNLKNITELISEENIPKIVKKCQLLVNASPVGMKEGDDSSIIDKEWLHSDLYVYDLVYNRETRLVRDAKDKIGEGRVRDGLRMLFYQGVYAFKFWIDKKPTPTTTMWEAIK
ncbi:MAG: shikimate dehydrogenase [Candidatus Omnitrophica bacterium]|nr:shikimate dehydrogenase [Candidatus Omnitrophota bacterium]